MRNVRIAEWILELVTSRERAASLAGDLMEDGSALGAFRFWASVAGAAGSMLWHDFASEWPRMLRLAAAGLIGGYLYMGGLVAVVVFIASLVLIPLGARGTLQLIVGGVMVLSVVLSQFLVGRWMARRAPGRELVPCAILIVLDTVLSVVLNLFWGHRSDVIPGLAVYQLANAILIAGAVTVRRRRMA